MAWRLPGLVAFASKLASSAAPHKPINVVVPDTYVPANGSMLLPLEAVEVAVPMAPLVPASMPAPVLQKVDLVREEARGETEVYMPLTVSAQAGLPASMEDVEKRSELPDLTA